MKRQLIFCLCLISSITLAYGQETIIPLWPEGIPNHQESEEVEFSSKSGGISWIENVQVPSLAVYLPAKMNATDMAVIVCPGGGYKKLAYDLEGLDIASWLNTKGITAFILKYRLPHSKSVIICRDMEHLKKQNWHYRFLCSRPSRLHGWNPFQPQQKLQHQRHRFHQRKT